MERPAHASCFPVPSPEWSDHTPRRAAGIAGTGNIVPGNNPLERIIRQIPRRTWGVGAFPDGHAALMLVAARLRHIASTKWGKRRYLAMETLLLISGGTSQHLPMSVARWHTPRSPRVLRVHVHAYACRIYVAALHTSIGVCRYLPAHPATPPLSASCSSAQRFAFGFLQIRSQSPATPLPFG